MNFTDRSPKVLVTGGAGYIGSHAVMAMKLMGFDVVVLDSLERGCLSAVDSSTVEFIIGNLADRQMLDMVFRRHEFDAVVHFAAYAYVWESMEEPLKYYRNNVVGSLTLLEAMRQAGVQNIVFSSTCATYGLPGVMPITEADPQHPINPYGFTKYVVEQMIADCGRSHGLKSVVFRYFNAAGADPFGRIGEDHDPETHLIPLILRAAIDPAGKASIYGTDYPTKDGTCVRDFIHVSDLANAHILGVKYLMAGGLSNVFNLGNGNGFSVREVVDTARAVTGKDIRVVEEPRRPGDPPELIGCAQKAMDILGWQPLYPDLTDIVAHAWQWQVKTHAEKTEAIV